MPMAAWAPAEWAGWICKKDGRAQRVQRHPCLHLAIGGYQVVYGAIDAAVTIVWSERGWNVAPL